MKIQSVIQPIACYCRDTNNFKSYAIEVLSRGVNNGRVISPMSMSHRYDWAYIDIKTIEHFYSKYAEVLSNTNISVFINISPYTLEKKAFYVWLKYIYRLDERYPGRIVIEVNEMTDKGTINFLRETINGRSIRIALDDYGTGITGINYIKKFPWNFIKVEMDVWLEISEFERHNLQQSGAEIIIEKVENISGIKKLLKHGPRLMQGYAFGKPTTPDLHRVEQDNCIPTHIKRSIIQQEYSDANERNITNATGRTGM